MAFGNSKNNRRQEIVKPHGNTKPENAIATLEGAVEYHRLVMEMMRVATVRAAENMIRTISEIGSIPKDELRAARRAAMNAAVEADQLGGAGAPDLGDDEDEETTSPEAQN
jgi:hypothetical protein